MLDLISELAERGFDKHIGQWVYFVHIDFWHYCCGKLGNGQLASIAGKHLPVFVVIGGWSGSG